MPIYHEIRPDFPANDLADPRDDVQYHHDLPYPIRAAYTEAAVDRRNHVSFVETDRNLKRRKLYAEGLLESKGTSLDDEEQEFSTNTRTALKHLGVEPDTIIKRYIVCSGCFGLTPYSDLYRLKSAACTALTHQPYNRLKACATLLYSVEGATRTPISVMPITPMSSALQYLFQDREFVKNLQSWRQQGDEVETATSEHHEEIGRSEDPYTDNSFAMEGLSGGSAWRSQAAHCRRETRADGDVRDTVDGPFMMRQDALEFGLKLVINMDWYAML
jgi:hypothetical protein